jgi:radical SAM-linked protein
MSVDPRVRVRIRFTKLGKIRWTSHRDLARMWERAFRRVGLPLAYSEGFSPRPKVSFGLALSTGHESVAEYLDVELSDASSVDLEGLPLRLSEALPTGVDAVAVAVNPPGTPSLQEDVQSSSWRWLAVPPDGTDGSAGAEAIEAGIEALLRSPSAVITKSRKGKPVTEDIRDGILQLNLIGPGGSDPSDGIWLEADLSSQPRSVRPADVLAAIGPGWEERLVRRTHQWILRDGARREPLEWDGPDGATDAPHALERAS